MAADPVVGMKVAVAMVVFMLSSLVGITSPIWSAATSEPVNTWVPASAATTAVAALAYGARKLARGELVPLNISEVIASQNRTNETLVRLAEGSHERESALRDTVVANTQALTAMTTTLSLLDETQRRRPKST